MATVDLPSQFKLEVKIGENNESAPDANDNFVWYNTGEENDGYAEAEQVCSHVPTVLPYETRLGELVDQLSRESRQAGQGEHALGTKKQRFSVIVKNVYAPHCHSVPGSGPQTEWKDPSGRVYSNINECVRCLFVNDVADLMLNSGTNTLYEAEDCSD